MANKTKAGLIGAIAVTAILALQAVERWTVVDAVLSGLHSKGAAGAWIADLLLSPVVPLVIAIAAIYLVFEGRRDESRNGVASAPNQPSVEAEASVSRSGNSSSTSTGNKVDIHIAANHPLPQQREAAEDDPIPVLQFGGSSDSPCFPSMGLHPIEDAESTVLTATFQNERLGVGKRTPAAYKVYAQLTYRSKKGKSGGVTVAHGHWIGQYTHFVDFGPGEKHLLTVLLRRSKDGFVYAKENRNSVDPTKRRFRSGITVLHGPVSILLLEPVFVIEIALLSKGTTLFEREFILALEPDGAMRPV
jgi:hypothetical protein